MHRDVLEDGKGYVRLVDWLGSDLSVTNAARVSFEKESPELGDRDKGLIRYLARHGHMSPFRHAVMTFEVRAPLLVARQWWKYVVGSVHDTMTAHNESSRRYVTEEPEFYVPSEWRKAAQDRKQGSDGVLELEDQGWLDEELAEVYQGCLNGYNTALEMGVTPEQARLFLPAYALYVRWRWTASLQGVCHFLSQRQAEDAQWEIVQYAAAVRELVEQVFPESVRALLEEA